MLLEFLLQSKFTENNECTYDFVEVFDGRNQDSLSLGRFCGNSTPPTITSSSNEMMVKFVADHTISSTGFVARYGAEARGNLIVLTSNGINAFSVGKLMLRLQI